jgi:REP element-mobilizing transposase RayT
MPRKRRVEFPGAMYHVTVRGNGRQDIFLNDADRHRFLESLSKRVEGHAVRLYFYCLMDNHVHLVLETPRGNLSPFMSSLLTSYAVYFNKRHERSGHLTQGRYHAFAVEGDEYIRALSRYVHLNPVKIHPVCDLALRERCRLLREYRWSSYRGYAGLGETVLFVEYRPVLAMFGRNQSDRCGQYQKFVEAGLAATDEQWLQIMKSAQQGIGSEKFRQALRTRVESSDKQGVLFRKKEDVLPVRGLMDGVCDFYGISAEQIMKTRQNSPAKPAAAWLLRRYCGLRHREVAALLGVKTEAAVSSLLKRASDASIQTDIEQITEDLSLRDSPRNLREGQ